MTAIPNGVSYDYQNKVRDLQEIFTQLVKDFPILLSMVKTGRPALNTKYEWLEDSLSPVATTISGFDTDGDGTGVNVGSTVGIIAGAILRFSTALDVSRTEYVKVASVDSATDLTVVRDYGGSVGETLVVGDKVFLVSSPKGEKTLAVAGAGQEPDVQYNYSQIFDRTADISKTAQAIKIYGLNDALDYQVQNKMKEIMWEMNNAIIYGRRVERSASENGTMGGILQYMESGNIESTGGAISADILNNMLQMIFRDGAFSNNFAILCADNQARKISAFNSAGDNPTLNAAQADAQSFGYYISRFVGDLPVQSGFTAPVVVDPNFPRDKVAIVDMNNIALVPLNGRTLNDEDATTPGLDGYARRILGEYTFEMINGKKSHAIAEGLDV